MGDDGSEPARQAAVGIRIVDGDGDGKGLVTWLETPETGEIGPHVHLFGSREEAVADVAKHHDLGVPSIAQVFMTAIAPGAPDVAEGLVESESGSQGDI